MIVDLAHMSIAGIEQTMPLLARPFVLSHAALRDAGDAAQVDLRRYNAATRNVPESVAQEVGARGGLFGVVMATQLLGGSALNSAARMIRRALDAAGDANVAIGSDMDGALKMLIDCEGLPALADALLTAGDVRAARLGCPWRQRRPFPEGSASCQLDGDAAHRRTSRRSAPRCLAPSVISAIAKPLRS